MAEPRVSSKDFVNTAYVKTVVIVSPKASIEQFSQNYSLAHENVIEGSLQKIEHDDDREQLALYTLKFLKIPITAKKEKTDPYDEFVKNMRDQFK